MDAKMEPNMEPHKVVIPRRMDRRAQGASRRREGLHQGARRLEPKAPRTALGESRKELCVRHAERQTDIGRSVRRQEPADRLSLHARSGLGSGLSELLAISPIISTAPPSILRNATSPLSSFRGRRCRRSRNSSGAWAGGSNGCRRSAATSTTTIRCRRRRRRRPPARSLYNYELTDVPERGTARRQRVLQERRRRDLPHLFELRTRSRYVDRRLSIFSISRRRAATRTALPFPWPGSATTTNTKAPSSIQKRHTRNRNPPHVAISKRLSPRAGRGRSSQPNRRSQIMKLYGFTASPNTWKVRALAVVSEIAAGIRIRRSDQGRAIRAGLISRSIRPAARRRWSTATSRCGNRTRSCNTSRRRPRRRCGRTMRAAAPTSPGGNAGSSRIGAPRPAGR